MDTSRPPRKKPTLRDVAATAGVSHGTVSRVINGGHWVSPESRRKVEDAMRDTGYTINYHARSLVTGRSESLAFLLTEELPKLFSDPTFQQLLRSATEAVTRRDMTLTLLICGTDDQRRRIVQYVVGGHVDGVMLISSHRDDPTLEILRDAHVPTVVCGRPQGHEGQFPFVAVDEVDASTRMVEYLRSRGHRRIATIAGPRDTSGGHLRLEGFRQEMGDDFDPALVRTGDWGKTSGYRAMTDLLTATHDIDAVFAASDSMASGAIDAIRDAGLSVPTDIAVAGFDDAGLAEENDPPITTMRQPWDSIADALVAALVELVDGHPVEPVVLPATLIARDSA